MYNFTQILLLAAALASATAVAAQQINTDTIGTERAGGHMFLNVDVPMGEFHILSSKSCGSSYSCLATSNTDAAQNVYTTIDVNGNMRRNVTLYYQASKGMTPKSMANARAIPNTPVGGKENYRSVYCPDPSASTDLNLRMESGSSRLDLSGLSLSNVDIRSAFADVWVSYSQPNRTKMQHLNISAGKANITLKNPELANADVIMIKNDMGDTKLLIESGKGHYSNITLRSGMGQCTIVVNPSHPVRIILRKGYFVTTDIAINFKEVGENTYENDAFRAQGKGTVVTCDADAGGISIMTNAQ